MAINTCAIVGRMSADPELKETPSGVAVLNFNVAVDRAVKKGEDKIADFIDCVAWRATAEFVSKWFHKGDWIGVSGRIQTDMYTDKDGNKRKAYKIYAQDVSFVGSKQNNSETASEKSNAVPGFTQIDDADIPF